MAKKILPLILCVLSMYGGCKLFNINDGRTDEAAKIKYKELCDNGVKTTAILQNEYTELKIKNSKSYNYKFDYIVDGKNYTGNITKREELPSTTIEITYNSKDPNIHTTIDPCKSYTAIKDNPPRRPQWLEYIGLGLVLLGLGYTKSSIVNLFKSK